jgi:hypothetical protein
VTPDQAKIYLELLKLPPGDPYRPAHSGDVPPAAAQLRNMEPPIEVLTIEARGRAAVIDEADRVKYGSAGAGWFNAGPAALASAAAGLPPQARAAADLPMINPPVHRKQIKPIPGEIDTEGWLAHVRKLPTTKKLSNKTRMAVARAIVWALGKASSPDQAVRGVAQISYTSIATAAECCRTQAWRAVKAFRAHGLLDIFNVVAREDNELYREPNAYALRGFTKAIPAVLDAVRDALTGVFDRASEQVRRFAHVWDMRPNRGGRGVDTRARPAPS